MQRRTKFTLLVVALVLLSIVLFAYLLQKAPPEAARLLPESDCILYFNLRPLRAYSHFDRQAPPHDPSYQKFIDATGFDFERDLDEAAFALYPMPDPLGPNGPVAFSEVFIGRFNGERVNRYLASISTGREEYAGHTIYEIPSEGRTVRVSLLGFDIAAVSNNPTPEQIHSILDRYRTAALPFSGSSLLSDHYADVPLLSLAWGIGKIDFPLPGDGIRIMGFRVPLDLGATLIASLRWTGALHLRLEEIATSEMAAGASSEAFKGFIAMARAAENYLPDTMTDADVRSLLDSTRIQQHKERAVVTATVPTALLKRMFTASGSLRSLPETGANPAGP
jgi:hypothetical protein